MPIEKGLGKRLVVTGGIIGVIVAFTTLLSVKRVDTKADPERGHALLDKYAPFHARFAAASLEIDQNEIQKALNDTLSLEEELTKANDDSLLHAYTLVRIAVIYQTLGQRENEVKAWQWVLKQMEGRLAASMALLEENFRCEGSTLRDYIQYRLSLAGKVL